MYAVKRLCFIWTLFWGLLRRRAGPKVNYRVLSRECLTFYNSEYVVNCYNDIWQIVLEWEIFGRCLVGVPWRSEELRGVSSGSTGGCRIVLGGPWGVPQEIPGWSSGGPRSLGDSRRALFRRHGSMSGAQLHFCSASNRPKTLITNKSLKKLRQNQFKTVIQGCRIIICVSKTLDPRVMPRGSPRDPGGSEALAIASA